MASTSDSLGVEAPAFEIERFAFAGDDRLEVHGRWSGVRGRRFVRPTLDVRGPDLRRRLLALLDHKPWAPDDEATWVAAFSWSGPPEGIASADLAVAPGIEVALGVPGEGAGGVAGVVGPRLTTPRTPSAAPAAAPEPRDAALREQQLLRQDRDAARAEREELRAERDDATGRFDALAVQRDAERARADALLTERDELRAQLAAAGAARERLEAQLAAVEAAGHEQRAEREVLAAERDRARAERDAALHERDEALSAAPDAGPRGCHDDLTAAPGADLRAERDRLARLLDAAVADRDEAVRGRLAAEAARPAAPAPTPREKPAAEASPVEVLVARVLAFGAIAATLVLLAILLAAVL